MTMPHMMNCSHSDTGWCLDCVCRLEEERQILEDMLVKIGKTLNRNLTTANMVNTIHATIQAGRSCPQCHRPVKYLSADTGLCYACQNTANAEAQRPAVAGTLPPLVGDSGGDE